MFACRCPSLRRHQCKNKSTLAHGFVEVKKAYMLNFFVVRHFEFESVYFSTKRTINEQEVGGVDDAV